MKHLKTLFALTLLTLALCVGTANATYTQCIPNQAKADFLAGVHLDSDTYKCALYVQANATAMDATATVYSTTGEIINGTNGTAGYTAGGVTVSRLSTILSGTKGVASFANPTFTGLTTPTGGVNGFIIYNTSKSNKIVYIGTITATSVTSGTLTITMPAQDSTNGLIRFARWLVPADRYAVLRERSADDWPQAA